jgi:hypothetical protein
MQRALSTEFFNERDLNPSFVPIVVIQSYTSGQLTHKLFVFVAFTEESSTLWEYREDGLLTVILYELADVP